MCVPVGLQRNVMADVGPIVNISARKSLLSAVLGTNRWTLNTLLFLMSLMPTVCSLSERKHDTAIIFVLGCSGTVVAAIVIVMINLKRQFH